LSLGDNGVHAIESGESNASYLSCIIPGIGLNTWAVAEFPILFDYQNIGHAGYNWTFSFYACDNFNIQMSMNGMIVDQNHYILSSAANPVSGNTFDANMTKLNTNVQSIEKLVENMHKSADKILENQNNETILKDYANFVKGIKNYTDVVHAASSASSALSAVVGFVRLIFGGTDPKTSTPPVAYVQQATLTGTMNIQRPLRSVTISAPGAFSFYPANLPWQPYNCPIGILNLKKEPEIRNTTLFERYIHYTGGNALYSWQNGQIAAVYYLSGYSSPTYVYPNEEQQRATNYTERYPGKYIKYKFDEDIVLAKQNIDGLTLKDVKFALVCKPSGTGDRKYKINTRYLAYYYFYNLAGQRYAIPTTNIVYAAIKDGRLIIHKYDEASDEIYFGTPYIPMNQFKGATIEVPEDTDVKLAVLATFQSNIYSDPIIFKTTYNLKKKSAEAALIPKVFHDSEQTNFLFSDYHESTEYTFGYRSVPYMETYTGKKFTLKSGFSGKTGFRATAKDYKGNGNTTFDEYDYNCNHSLRSARMAYNMASKMETADSSDSKNISFYPNPCYGVLFIKLPEGIENAEVKVYNMSGNFIKSYPDVTNESVLDVSSLGKGEYLFTVISKAGAYTQKVFVN
jgi:flagellar hook-basal body complex protein FliE